uniref:RhLWE1 protein n=1 Tax=Orthetrum albistylum TaxID=254766 RepID=A0A0C6FZ21_9ODON|nr:opsin, long-wavelength sensitive type [Orthetrum albistylum]
MAVPMIGEPKAFWGGRTNVTMVDMVLPDMLPLIDSHWYQFPPMSPVINHILGFIIGCLGFISWSGNGVVLYIFSTTKSLRTPSNLLVVNLAFSDFFMMVIMCPFMLVNCFSGTWVFGPLMCELYAFFGSLFGGCSIWTMVLISVDRYRVIVKGLSAKPLTINKALGCIILVWIHALIWTLMPMFGWNRYVPEGNLSSCGTDFMNKDWFHKSYILVYSVFVYFIPLLSIIFSYWFIIKAVAAHERTMREQAKKMNVASLRSAESQNTSAECKLAKVALTTISLWFMAWTPYLIINYAGIFGFLEMSPMYTIWGSLFAKASAVYNPIVYGLSHPKYRSALNEKMPFLICGPTDANASESESSGTTAEDKK